MYSLDNVPHGAVFNSALSTQISQLLNCSLNDMIALTAIILDTPPSEAFNICHLTF
jgi:hypothetical protein